MPLVGIIRGYGEGLVATAHIIKLIKALNKRFRSGIKFCEIPAGDIFQHGRTLKSEALDAIKLCDCIFVGDMLSDSNMLDYRAEHIAVALSDDTEYTCISGFGEYDAVNIHFVNYFDGGTLLRDGERNRNGATETRTCSTYTAMNIVKSVTQICAGRSRRLAFIKDGDNEYCADIFLKKFEEFTMPMSNFHLVEYSVTDMASELIYNPNLFDTVFASKTFAEAAKGILQARMGEYFAAYNRYLRTKPIYAVKSHLSNSFCGSFVPSIISYVTAFSDMLADVFDMKKEAYALHSAIDNVLTADSDISDTDLFISRIIDAINKPVNTKFSKK